METKEREGRKKVRRYEKVREREKREGGRKGRGKGYRHRVGHFELFLKHLLLLFPEALIVLQTREQEAFFFHAT
jgi:hypothetical protein